MTAWRRPIRATWRATRAGSSGSFQVGLPVLTWQKPQRRVQVSPRIMKVAVPRSQQSPMFGQAASWQTVCRLSSAILAFSSRYFGPPGMGTLNHFGLRSRMSRTSGPRTFRTSMPPGLARERVLCSRVGGVAVRRPSPPRLPGADEVHAGARERDEGEDEEAELQRGVVGRAAVPGDRGARRRRGRRGCRRAGRSSRIAVAAAPGDRGRVEALAAPQPGLGRADQQAADADAEQRAAGAEQDADAALGQRQRGGGAAELVEERGGNAGGDDDEEDLRACRPWPPGVGAAPRA